MDNFFTHDSSFLPTDKADTTFTWLNDQAFKIVPFRKYGLTSRPKLTFVKDETVGAYRYGQHKTAYYDGEYIQVGFPKVIQDIADMLPASVNTCLVTKYTDGRKNHIPWHHDKPADLVAGSPIYNIVVCDKPRVFQLALPENIDKNGKQDAHTYVFNEPLQHGSCITLTAAGNNRFKHRVPKEKDWKGNRYSIVFRTIKTRKEQTMKKSYKRKATTQ